MKPRSEAHARRRLAEAVILFTVGEQEFAITAAAVDEIRNTDGLVEFCAAGSGVRGKVRHSVMRDGKSYFVVDADAHFKMPSTTKTRLLVLRDMPVAVLVAQISRMTEISVLHPLPRAFQGEERNWFKGLMLVGKAPAEAVVPVVDPEAFLSRREAEDLTAQLTGANLS